MKYQASFDSLLAYVIFLSSLIVLSSYLYSKVTSYINVEREKITYYKAYNVFQEISKNGYIDLSNLNATYYRLRYEIVAIDLPQNYYGKINEGVYTLGNLILINTSKEIYFKIPKDCFVSSSYNYSSTDFYYIVYSSSPGNITTNSSCIVFINSNDNFKVNEFDYYKEIGKKYVYYYSYQTFFYIKNKTKALAKIYVDVK